MPEKSQTITAAGYDAGRLLATAYGALQELNWTIKYAGENVLVAYTPRSWNKYDQQITIRVLDNQLTVTSKMIHGELFDIMGKNKRYIADFLASFETIKSKATDQNTGEWNEKITLLKEGTIKTAEQEAKEAAEADKVMNLSKGNLYVTYGIIAVNVLIFVLMGIGGIDLFSPTGIDIINWGANFGPLTLSGDWWRLITCVFVHIGIIHLAFNMYALYMVGVYLEPMLGKTKYIVAYLCTGVFASLASIWWHSTPVPSAGASGAIFGMYGVFLALLSTNLIPKQIRNGLLQSIGIFIVYNLVYGLKSGVDNAAHTGGLLSGFLIGYLYFPGLKEKEAGKKKGLVMGVVAALTFFSAFLYVENKKVTNDVRAKTKEDINSFTYKDADKFGVRYNDIIEMQNKALAPLNDKSLTDDQLLQKLTAISLPEWEKADSVVKELRAYNVSDKSKQKAEVMQEYITMRKEQISLIRKLIVEKDETVNSKLDELNNRISQVVEKLGRL